MSGAPADAGAHWRVRLPEGATALGVYLNSVEQAERTDWWQAGTEIVFAQPLAGRRPYKRWQMAMTLLLGNGFYPPDDQVDVRYRTADGATRLASGLTPVAPDR